MPVLWRMNEAAFDKRRRVCMRVVSAKGVDMRIRGFAVCIALACAFMAPPLCADDVKNDEGQAFADYCVDAVLDSLNGRTWLVTDGFADALMVQRAKAKGIDLVAMPLRMSNASGIADFEKAVKALGNPKLEAAAALGTAPFVLTWLAENPKEAVTNLALMVEPSLAKVAGFTPLPSGLVYTMEKPEGVTADVLKAAAAKYLDLRDSLGERIVTLPEMDVVAAFEKRIRAQAAMCGNNLGVLLYEAQMTNQALNLFSQANSIDTGNISSLLNKASVVRGGVRPELAEKLAEALNALARSSGGSWSLASTSGYVVEPAEFLPAKWYWVASGIAVNDRATLDETLSAIEDEGLRNAVARQLSASFAMQTGGAQPAMMLLAEFPKEGFTWEFMLKTAELQMVFGDKFRAVQMVERAAAAPGADVKTVAFARAGILGRTGKADEAVKVLMDVKTPENEREVLMRVASIYGDAQNTAKLAETVQALASLKDAPSWIGLLSQSLQAQLGGSVAKAKKFSDEAVATGGDADFVCRHALMMDMMTSDKATAEKHADALLAISRFDAFANYVKATMLSERKQYPEAEQHFQISISQNPAWFVMNDYAAMVIETGRFEMAEMLARNALASGGERFAAVWDTLGAALLGLKRDPEALQAIKTAVEKDGGDDPRIQLRYAECSLNSGDAEAAKASLIRIDKRAGELSVDERERLGRLRKELDGKDGKGK